jgi:hypothetical protein
MKGTEYFVSLYTSVFPTVEYNVVVIGEELNVTTAYLTQYTKCHLNLCRQDQVRLHY